MIRPTLNSCCCLASPPVGNTNSPGSEIPVDRSITMSCSLNYTGTSNLPANITWDNGLGSDTSTTGSITSTRTIQASLPSVPAYTCTSSFGPFTATPPTGQNPTPPSQTYSMTFPAKTVLCKFAIILHNNVD